MGASRRVKTTEEGEDSEGRSRVWRAAKETTRLCVKIIVYKASQSSSLCSSIKTLRDEEGLQGRDYVPLNRGDRLRGGEGPACTYCLDYEEGGEAPGPSYCLSQSPSPACQSISKQGRKCEAYQSTNRRSMTSLIFSFRLTLVFTLIIFKSEL